ncbi:M48 family metalloprotease [Dongia sp.]|uniref:M48 family metalloprotease n=1 Tax=Dongia sp. TaxID=1977262 RepID=UPI0035B0A5D0
MRLKHSFAVLLLAGTSLIATGCMQATSPATGRTFSTSVTEAQENKIGADEHPKILAEFGGAYSEKPALNTYIDSVGQFVAATAERQDVKYTFTVLNSSDINAFALPGGYVYVTRGLLGLAVNEAEVAGVLGHEIGHVNARHTAERMGQQQKAQIGATLGTLLGAVLGGEQGAQMMGALSTEVAQNYLGKYSQEQEFEADSLGVRYLKRATYDPQAMATFLGALNADTHLEARLAGNEAAADAYSMKQSHPRTADRVQQAINQAGPAAPGAMIARNEYLTKIDGMLWGDDPNDGVVKGREFIHPGLRFTFTAPPGFKLQNQPSQVVGQGDNAAMIFDLAPDNVGDLATYVQSQWNPKAKIADVQRTTVNGMDAATGTAQGKVGNSAATFRLIAVRFPDNHVYRFLFAAPVNTFGGMDQAFWNSANTFRQLAANEATGYKPMRIRLVEVKQGDTIEGLASRMVVPEAKVDWFKVLNRLDQGQPLQAGQLVKIVSY